MYFRQSFDHLKLNEMKAHLPFSFMMLAGVIVTAQQVVASSGHTDSVNGMVEDWTQDIGERDANPYRIV